MKYRLLMERIGYDDGPHFLTVEAPDERQAMEIAQYRYGHAYRIIHIGEFRDE